MTNIAASTLQKLFNNLINVDIMRFNQLSKFTTRVGATLLLCSMLSIEPITASPLFDIRFQQTLPDDDKNDLWTKFKGGINWSDMNDAEKKALKNELKKLPAELVKASAKFKEEIGEELFSKQQINEVKAFVNKSGDFDFEEMQVLAKELAVSAMVGVKKSMEAKDNPFKTFFGGDKNSNLFNVTTTTTTTTSDNCTFSETTSQNQHEYYTLTEDMVTVSPISYNGGKPNSYIKSVINEKNVTKVTFVNAIHFSSNWTQFTSTSYLRDIETNKRYYPLGIERGIPLDSLLIIEGHAQQMVEFTLIYPRIDSKAKQLLYCNVVNEKFKAPSNASKRNNILIKLDEFKPVKEGLIIRELLDGKFVLCSDMGYRLNSQSYDKITVFKRKKSLFYLCYLNGKICYEREVADK